MMEIDLSEVAAEFGRTALRALGSAGGDALVQTAESQPEQREGLLDPVFAALGAWDLEPRRDPEQLEASAALCRSTGYWAAPYPVAERLCRPSDIQSDGQVVVSTEAPAGSVTRDFLRWTAVNLQGDRSVVHPRGEASPPRRSAFVTGLALEPLDSNGSDDLALGLVLPCWTILGMIDRAMELTRDYVVQRRQFGQTLASYQGVQFQLTDAELERNGLAELAKYSLWTTLARPQDAIDDALALRVAALEAAETVFRVAHQLHGAIGFCDETPLSWLSRYSQPLRRLPWGLSATREHLARRVDRRGLAGLFDSTDSFYPPSHQPAEQGATQNG